MVSNDPLILCGSSLLLAGIKKTKSHNIAVGPEDNNNNHNIKRTSIQLDCYIMVISLVVFNVLANFINSLNSNLNCLDTGKR